MDPLTGAVCNPPEIWKMTDEMLIAQAQWLPQYSSQIAEIIGYKENDEVLHRDNLVIV